MKPISLPSIWQFAAILVLVFCTSVTAKGQVDLSYYLPDTENLNPDITSPEEFLGFQVGEWHISHSQQVYYLKKLAEESDRIQFHTQGISHEGRPMVHLFISASENMANLESIREEHLRWSEPGSDLSEVNSDRPLIVWQGYSIHGNEASGANSAILVAYYLAASNSDEVLNILKNTVIVFYPSFNPDGMQRFSSWVNMNKSKTLNPDNQDREYDEVWPGGRTNHYGFDLNRDWLPVQQPESKDKIKLFQQWRPNILTDHHEMGTNSTYFFQPGIPSRNNPMTPETNVRLTEEIGTFHAHALDSIASLYYSRESFDDFYYGKGSTYPDIQGCIGILFEQASSRGHIQNSDYGLLTFPFTIRNQVVTSFSTLRAGLRLKSELQEYQRDFFHSQDRSTQEGYVFGDKRYPHKTRELAEILTTHDIQVYHLDEDLNVDDKYFEADGSFYVPLDQRQQQLILTIFETNLTFQDSLFYDVSTWTLPLAFNLPYSLVNQPSGIELVNGDLMRQTESFKISEYAYVLNWEHYLAPKILYQLLNHNIRAYVSSQPFSYQEQNFDYGSILIPVQNQDHDLIASILREAVEVDGVPVAAIPTGSTTGVNLGSGNFRKIEMPRVGLLIGDGVTISTSGEVWHLMDTRYEIPVTRLDGRKFASYDLDQYNVLVLAGGRILNSSHEKLNAWLGNGGTLIVQGTGGRWIANQFPGHFKYKTSPGIDSARVPYDQMNALYGARVTGGAIMRTTIDLSHPLNYGYRDTILPVFKNNSNVFEADPLSFRNPIVYDADPLWSGYLHQSNRDLISGGTAVQVAAIGSGRIINFADDVNFRAFWYGTNRLFANSLFFGRLISSRATR